MASPSLLRPVFALFLLVAGAACERASVDALPFGSSEKLEPDFRISDYPIHRQLTDSQGRPLEGHIVAKAEGSLYVLRSSDETNFEIPIADLSQDDQEFAERLPELMPPPGFRHGERAVSLQTKGKGKVVTSKPVPAYIANRREEIERLEQKIERLDIEIRSTNNTMIIRSRNEQIQRILEDIYELKADIERYELEQRR